MQSSKTDAYDERYIKIIEAGEEIDKRIDKLVDKKIEASSKIDELDELDNTSAVILRERYINLKSWEDISENMNYSLRHVMNLHSKALMEFDKTVKWLHFISYYFMLLHIVFVLCLM